MANIINGTAGADALNGLSGDNVINSGAGADKINGGASQDTMDGGSGSDTVSGNSGDDLLLYKASENAGSTDVYDGGSGKDTLQLNLTLAEWNSAAVQTDLANYLNFLTVNTNVHTDEATNAIFKFTAFGLQASKIEYVQVSVNGALLSPEDNAVILGADTMNAGENTAGVGTTGLNGNLFSNDSVLDQVNLFSFTQPTHGSVSMFTNFSVVNAPVATPTYTPTAGDWDYLAVGETGNDSFTYTVTDADGDTQTATVTVHIAGANDPVTITSGAQGGDVVEDAPTTPSPTDSLNAGGTISFSDVDLSDGHTATFAAAASNTTALGTFGLGAVSEAPSAATGSVGWTYALTNTAAQYLAAGQVVTETYVVTLDDSHGSTTTQNVVITVTGTNDDPVITAQDLVGGVLEQTTPPSGNLSDTGVITFTDVDLTDVHLVSATGTPIGSVLGALTAVKNSDTTGTGTGGQLTWTYSVADSAVEYLAAGQTKVESFTITLDDQHGGLITKQIDVTVTGTNDAPLITAQDLVGGVLEQTTPPSGNLSDTGVITFTDVDLTDVHLVSATGTPIGSVLGALTAVKDSDTTGTGTGGQLTWTYSVADSAVEYLAKDETKVESFTITLDDQHGGLITKQIDVTVTGTNDDPVITAQDLVGGVLEQTTPPSGNLSDTGVITFTDVDLTDVHLVSATGTPIGSVLGSLTAVKDSDTTGAGTGGQLTWTYSVADFAVEYLAAGQTKVESFTITLDDQHGGLITKQIDVTVTGTNDAPLITSGAQAGAVVEDAPTTPSPTDSLDAAGTVSFSDVDLTDGHTASFVAAASNTTSLGTFTLDPVSEAPNAALGSVGWTYALDNAAAQSLAGGQVVHETYVVTVDDGHGGTTTQNVVITITGTDDAPVAVADTLAATEDTAVTYTAAQLLGNDTDVDNPPADLHIASVTSGVGGTAVLNLDGTVTFTPSADFNGVAHFTYTTTDGTLTSAPATETVNVAAVNDAPVFTSGATGSVAENSPIATVVYDANVTDVDGGPATFSLTGIDAGKFNINASTGEVTFKLSPDFETPTDDGGNNVYDVVVNAFDGTDTTTKAVAISVTNVNEAPVIDSDGGGATATKGVPENTTAVTTVHATDPDAATTLGYSIIGGADMGKFTINPTSGVLSFVAAPDFEAPSDDDHNNSYIVQVRASDGSLSDDQTITVNVTDVAEGPVDTQGPTSIGFALSTTGSATDAGGVLIATHTVGTFVAQGDPNSVTFHYALSGTDAGKFALDTTTGVLSVGAVDVAAAVAPYAITITALDQANNAVSEDVKVWVGGTADNTLVGVGTNIDFQFGLNGNDTLTGGGGDDALIGGQLPDLLIGGAGADQLFGGGGSDKFSFTGVGDAQDKILDFLQTTGNADTVQLSLAGFSLQNSPAVSIVPDTAASISTANIVRWTGAAGSMDTAGEINTFLAGKAGTFAGGVFVLAYDPSGKAALWYDSSASNGASTVTEIATFDNLTSTSGFGAGHFLFV